MNSEPNEGIVFVTDETTGVGLAVKAMAERHGFKWERYVERPVNADSSFVFVGSDDDALAEMVDRCCCYIDVGSKAWCAHYEVNAAGGLADADEAVDLFAQSVDEFTDWLLTELHWYGRWKIAVLGVGELSMRECRKTEMLFDRVLLELIKSEAKADK